ncbi:dynamin family protein [Anabaena sphaerica FACHB-251]|uniref:Dynamin family protein n=1 Tax=Anabaena sphaerica FACHB-251 TaxID=2692883 RepID=A0A926WFT4_9NOST|nr:dynamin family protein [Anabaena sphaerica]MBD2292691.1 dynamin family protein [Anabaena sphaerica FACHB-251]
MDTSRVTSETVDLLSRITGQKLSQRDITPQVLFLAALVTVLMGVIFVDGTVSEEEKQHLQKILSRFSQSNSDVQKLTNLMIKGVKENQTYKKIQDLLKLTLPLSESEKILLIGFGYEMSAADGEIDLREKQYLEIVAKNLGVKSQYLPIFEIAFTQEGNIEANALNEVHFLLDSSRFQELDTVFVKAASDMLAILPAKPEIKTTQKHTILSYDELKKFQIYRQELDNYCNLVSQIIHECKDHSFLPSTLIDDITEVFNKIKNQRFRLAVIGEFSQGKSTLLNALLGEEIQPVRAVPCSGAVTVLKYGTQKRVICHYKDGRVEEIAFDQYKAKASISKEAAVDHRSDELAQSEIEEIIFEHPELTLCKSGVEIIDSPGLNEHPQRTAITHKILTNTDAAIFLTNATRLLPEKEKELLHDVRYKLNNSSDKEPAENLFVLVNFMDNLDNEEDVQDIKQRLENFVKKENLIVLKEINRVHYISAKAALKSIQNGNNDEYLQSFKDFTLSLEKFLTFESGKVKIHQSVEQINRVIHKSLNSLSQSEQTLEGKIQISEAQKLEILEKIGEVSGRDVRIRVLVSSVIDEVYEKASESYDEWRAELGDRMAEKSVYWHSEHNPVFSQDKLIKDYTNQFIRDLSKEIDEWGNKILKDIILKEGIEYLDANIAYELDAIQGDFQRLDQQIQTNFSQQMKLSIGGISDDFMGLGGIGGGIGVGGALAAGLIVFTGLGFIAVIVAAVAATIASSFGFGLLDFDGLSTQIKQKVYDIGFQKFEESVEKVSEKLDEIINTVFNSRIEGSSRVIAEAISLYENLIEQQEKAHQETLEQREIEKSFINQKRQELEQVQKELQTIIKY